MMKLRSAITVFVSACGLVIASSGCSPVQTVATVEPGVSFTLAPGQAATVRGTNTQITLKQVREDSRCPVDVTCVWEGDAKIEIVVSRDGATEETKILSLRSPGSEAQAGRLRIRFVGLSPVPRQADANRPRKYLAEFVADAL